MAEAIWICLNCGIANGPECEQCGSKSVSRWMKVGGLREVERWAGRWNWSFTTAQRDELCVALTDSPPEGQGVCPNCHGPKENPHYRKADRFGNIFPESGCPDDFHNTPTPEVEAEPSPEARGGKGSGSGQSRGCICREEPLALYPDAYEESNWRVKRDPNCPVHGEGGPAEVIVLGDPVKDWAAARDQNDKLWITCNGHPVLDFDAACKRAVFESGPVGEGERAKTRPHRIGICFNDYEPFYWDADGEPNCPGCPVESETPEDQPEHRFYVAEAVPALPTPEDEEER